MAFRTVGSRAGSDVFGYRPAQISSPTPQSDLRGATPQYDQLLGVLSGDILNNLQGVLPQAVQDQIMDTSNARNMALGIGGSPFANRLTLRDLGLNQLARMDTGVNQALNYFPVQSQTATLSPQLQANIAETNSLFAAAPDPAKRAQWEIDQWKAIQDKQERDALISKYWGGGSGGISYSNLTGGRNFQYSGPSVGGFGAQSPNLTPVVAQGTAREPNSMWSQPTPSFTPPPAPGAIIGQGSNINSVGFGNWTGGDLQNIGTQVDRILTDAGIA